MKKATQFPKSILCNIPNKGLLSLIFCFFTCFSEAQNAGDYRSFSSGNWSNTSSWERYNGATWINPAPSAPTSTDGIITIRSGNTITINGDIATDETVVEAGGTPGLQAATLGKTKGRGEDIFIN